MLQLWCKSCSFLWPGTLDAIEKKIVTLTENSICHWDQILHAILVIKWDTAEDSKLADIKENFSTDFLRGWIRPLWSYLMNVQC